MSDIVTMSLSNCFYVINNLGCSKDANSLKQKLGKRKFLKYKLSDYNLHYRGVGAGWANARPIFSALVTKFTIPSTKITISYVIKNH